MTPDNRRGTSRSPDHHRGLAAMMAMMALYFLVLLAVGILRPIRNTLALDGLGQTDFYKVYLVSALVILFVPILNRLSDFVPWRRLIPGVALFFALNLLVFRALYVEGSTAFGLIFYGWYDLFAAALVTQLFMATQLFFHARLAKNAYPLVISGGAIGASAGGAITGFLAESAGTPNLLLVAALLIGIFSVAVAIVWSMEGMVPATSPSPRRRPGERSRETGAFGFRAIFGDRQVRLIMALVLVTILVKQLVDYQFNTITKEVFLERDAIAAFQGKFNAATQWLPIVVLATLRSPLKRWGVGFVVLILPVAMLFTNVGLILFWGLWAAVGAKGAETSFRYSAERTGREILYLPVPDEIKLKAKAYIDVAVEKGVGKVSSALLIFGLLTFLEYRHVAYVGAGLSLVWIAMAISVRREYVRCLARAVENRFASLRGVFTSLADASAVPVLREALEGDARQVAFALDLLHQASPEDARPLAEELGALLDHPSPEIRRRALVLLGRVPGAVEPDILRSGLEDPEPRVREAAVRALHATRPEDGRDVLRELLASDDVGVRTATLACLARGEIDRNGLDLPAHLSRRLSHPLSDDRPSRLQAEDGGGASETEGADERVERALVAVALRPPDAARTIEELLDDPDARVASTALRGAGMLDEPALRPRLIAALKRPATREAAREALALQGTKAVPVLAEHLLDPRGERTARRHIPSVLARMPAPETVAALIRCILAPETDQVLDHRAIKALSKLRAANPELRFDAEGVDALMSRSLEACRHYAAALRSLADLPEAGPRVRLLARAVEEARAERREEVFRCLGLRYPSEEVYRCYLAIVRGETVPRANALEWLERTVGFQLFRRLAPVLGEEPTGGGSGPASGAAAGPDLRPDLERLERDEDRWIARCAAGAALELGLRSPAGDGSVRSATMDLIEMVFLLQRTDVLREARSAHLALLASIAEEVDVEAGTVLMRLGEPADALHVVVRGEVELVGEGGPFSLADGMSFGTWALIDEMPSVVEAKATRATRLLRLGREDFHDLMADYPELAIGMLQGLARRVRTLVG